MPRLAVPCPKCGAPDNRLCDCIQKEREERAREKGRIRHRKYSHTRKGRETRQVVEHRRTAQERKVVTTLTLEDWQKAIEYFDNKCAYCDSPDKLHRDHFIPLSAGGESTKRNIVPVCRKCNTSKKDLDPLEWFLTREHGIATYTKVFQYLQNMPV